MQYVDGNKGADFSNNTESRKATDDTVKYFIKGSSSTF